MPQLLSLGGGAELAGKKEDNAAKRFKPMVKFLGPFELKVSGKGSHKIKMPNYVGSVRTMIIAGHEGAYGSAEKTTPVRKPLMVLATLPRVLGPGEQVALPVTVFAMEDHIKNVDLEIETNGLFSTPDLKKNVQFSRTGEQVIYFDLSVVEAIGVGKVKVKAKSGKETATYDIELDVRNPNPEVTEFADYIVEEGKTWTTDYTPVGMAGTNTGVLEISNIPPIDFGRRLRYLIRYPHGCVEQTTSSVFPQLYLTDVMKLDAATKHSISENISAGIDRLRSFQLPSGALAYWPGNNTANDWGTSYAGHFMIEAERRGYTLPIGFKSDWLSYQKRAARNYRNGNASTSYYEKQQDMIQAYRLYVLALAKSPELGAMNRLRESGDLSKIAAWRLAAAYKLAGQPEVARSIIKNLGTDVAPYQNAFTATYGSSMRDKAMILETLVLLEERSMAYDLVKEISEALESDQWMSTNTTAFCLMAMSSFAGKDGVSREMKFKFTIDGKTEELMSYLPVSQHPIAIDGTQKGQIRVENLGDGILYARIVMTGIPVTGDQVTSNNKLNMTVTYKDMSGNTISVEDLEQGTDFMAEVTVQNPSATLAYKDMALTQIFPSGWEIHNMRMDGSAAAFEKDKPTYEDIRDDRVYTYFDVYKNKQKTFTFLLNASYVGKFYMPTVYCEAMYDHTINARRAGRWIEVRKPGSL